MLTVNHRWARLKCAVRVALQEPTLYPLHAHPAFDVHTCQTMFMRNQMLLHAYAASQGSQALTYLQPCNGRGRRPLSHRDVANLAHLKRRVSIDGTTELEAVDRFYEGVAAEFERRNGEFVDITRLFDGMRAHVYIDQVHCSDVGYDLIARRVADDILGREGVAF